MLWTPRTEFAQIVASNGAGAPSDGNGTTITAAGSTHTDGSYTAVGSALPSDAYAIEITIWGSAVSGSSRAALMTMGVDTAGGSSYVDLIPFLQAGQATTSNPGGARYLFPLFIPSGSTLAAKVRNSVASGTALVEIRTLHKPKNPHLWRCGSGVEAIGIVGASSRGTNLTAAAHPSEGAWTSLGTSTRTCWWWQIGTGWASSSMTANDFSFDLSYGDGTNQRTIIEDAHVAAGTAESLSRGPRMGPECACEVLGGSTLYARVQSDGSTATVNAMAYGVF